MKQDLIKTTFFEDSSVHFSGLPKFPEFKKIEYTQREQIESYTRRNLPFSDFNFTSLWAWDTEGGRKVSDLNGNLVVQFTDYQSEQLFFSLLGINEIDIAVRELISYAESISVSPVLRLVPATVAETLSDTKFSVTEDQDNFDYIYSVARMAFLQGGKLKEKRHSAERFIREYPQAEFRMQDFDNDRLHDQISSVLYRWKDNRNLENTDLALQHEESAIHRLLDSKLENLLISSIFLNDEMIGFSIDELLPDKYAMSHFFKVDHVHGGVGDFLNMKIARRLLSHDVMYWNWEQDLGVDNLRRSKSSYRPVEFLKKYKVGLSLN